MPEFDWDDANRDLIAKHGISAVEAEEFIVNDPIDLARQDEDGEQRYLQLGERVRIVTAYDAPRKWRNYYLSHRLDFRGH